MSYRADSRACLAVAAIIGLAAASFAFCVGLKHNTQPEFNLADGSLDWSYIGILFAGCFSAVSFGASLLCGAGMLAARVVRSLTSGCR